MISWTRLPYTAVPAVLLLAGNAWAADSGNSSFINASLRMTWGLLIVLGVLLILYAVLKKRLSFFQGGGAKGVIRIIDMRHISPKKTLMLVQVRDKEFLIGTGSDSITMLAALDRSESDSFAKVLKDSTEGHEP